MAAAGTLLTATGAFGALCFASWALVDRLRPSAAPLPASLSS
jgi:7-keto-8-aminopelargonate synthetase-like enzyme